MSSQNETLHIADQIAHPNIFIGIATTGRVYSKSQLVETKRPSEAAINHLKSKLTMAKQKPPSPQPNSSPPPSLTSPPSITTLKFPTRLTSFLIFISRFNASYAGAFYPIWKNLEKLETICLNPHLRNNSEEEDEIWKWVESRYAGVFLGDFEEGRREVMERIVLETMVGEVQVGVLMGVGILRVEVMGIDEGMGGEGIREGLEGDRERLEEWIKEGEDFVIELDGLKRIIGERDAEMRYMKEVVKVYGNEGLERECSSEGPGGFVNAQEEDEEDVAPPIPRRSSKRNPPIEGLK